MADSEISRTLPLKTHTNLFSAVAEFLAVSHQNPPAQTGVPTKYDDEAGVIEAWQRWSCARTLLIRLNRRQQQLEKKLLETIGGFPQIKLIVPGRQAPVSVRTIDEIDRLFVGIDLEEKRSQATVALASAWAAWDSADAEIGYSVACAAEKRAYERAQDLADELWRKRAISLEHALAKLHCLIEMEEPGPFETPWPQLRGILYDLLTLTGR